MQVLLLCALVLCWGQVHSALRRQEQAADKGGEETSPGTQTAAPRSGAPSERGKMQGEDRIKSAPPKRNVRRKPERNTKPQFTAASKLETNKTNQSARPRFRKQEERALQRKEVGIRRQEMGSRSREVLSTGKQEVVMPKKQEVTEPKKQEVTTPKKQDMMTPKKQEVTTPKKQEVTTPKKHKVMTLKKQEVTAPKKQEVRSGEQEVKTGKQKVGVVKKQEVQKYGKKIEKPAVEKRGGGREGGGSRVRLIDLQDSDEEDLEEEFEDIGGLVDDLDDFFFDRPLPDSLLPPTGRFMESLPPGCILSDSTIACGNTRMRHLPILLDPGVTTLYLAENEISEIPEHAFLGLPNLEWLDLSKNQMDNSTMHPGVFRNLIKLKRLNLDGNQITQIPPLPPSLEELKMNDNKLQGLDQHSFKGLSKLLTLELEGNALHDGNVNPLAFKPLRRLIYLRLDRNLLRAIPSGLPHSLQELHLAGNVIEEVSEGVLSKTLNLSVLVLSNNHLQETHIAPLAWIHLPAMDLLDLSYNGLVHVPSFLPSSLRRLLAHHNHIERIPGYVFAHMKPGLEFLHLSHNQLHDSGIHALSFLGLHHSLAELLLENNQLTAVPRGILTLRNLQVLRLNNNYIRYVPLNSVCDTRVMEDSPLISVHLENNLIDRRLIPPTAFSCIKTYHSIVLRPQKYEDY
ncbi:extracellular matrix protein 2-like isoform X2 [Polyodon spathula]|uniref:extracellular matrix protein 2-like isoform X2 n=1 Tax=Polyodon spathula TaxID=7913 RepID=UPI001B7EDA34|nr:extracellular matrix protein 2-like isoform X2 [Polyodon spathula]